MEMLTGFIKNYIQENFNEQKKEDRDRLMNYIEHSRLKDELQPLIE